MSDGRTAAGEATDLRAILLLGYSLLALAVFNGATAIVAVVLAYVKRDAARGTIYESHVRNIIQIFWITIGLSLVALAVSLPIVGNFAMQFAFGSGNPSGTAIASLVALASILCVSALGFFGWYLYRTLRGLVRTIEFKSY